MAKFALFKTTGYSGELSLNRCKVRIDSNTEILAKVRIMSSTSQKHRNFVSEPMGEKSVSELAGIGPVLSGRLEEKGFDKAYVVLGQFLVLKKDEEMFMDWIKDTCGANKKQGSDCYNCLKEWCDAFL